MGERRGRSETEGWWQAAVGTTHWSRLRVGTDPSERRTAYEYFYETYRGVVYRYYRSRGVSIETAGDLAQDFFVRCLGSPFLERADPSKGRFRSYLLTAADRFLVDHWRREGPSSARARALAAIDDPWTRYEPVDPARSPEECFDREWARAVLAAARDEVAGWYETHGRGRHFDAFLQRAFENRSSREIGEALDIPASRVDAICTRARDRLEDALRKTVARTIDDPSDLEDELAYLRRLLGSSDGA